MSSKWTIARHTVQLGTIALILSPRFGGTFFSGNLASGQLFGISLSDPLATLQATIAARLLMPSLLGSAALIALLYVLTGGRSFCGWVCPVYLITELTDKLRARLGTGQRVLPLATSRWTFAVALLLAAITALPVFEIISPISMVTRALMFGSASLLLVITAIIAMEVMVSRRLWCRSLCPVGGFYALLGRFSPVRIAFKKERCTMCGECSRVCPVEEVLDTPLLGGAIQVTAGDCTRCAACIDTCQPRALGMSISYKK